MYRWVFFLALVSTLLGRAWQVVFDGHAVGSVPSVRWLFVGACVVAALSMLIVTVRSPRYSPTVIWSVALVAMMVLLIIPIIKSLDNPLHAYGVGKFAAQFLTPMVLAMTVMAYRPTTILRVSLIAISLCFGIHGLLDLGYPATPSEYIRTTQAVLGWAEPDVRRFLAVAGIADIAVAILIWWRPTQIPALVLAGLWGTCTILARILAWGHCDWSTAYQESWTYETLVRLPHLLLPLAASLLVWQLRRDRKSATGTVA